MTLKQRASRKRNRWQVAGVAAVALSVGISPCCQAKTRLTEREVAIHRHLSGSKNQNVFLCAMSKRKRNLVSIFDDDRHNNGPDEHDVTDDPLDSFSFHPSISPTIERVPSQSPSRIITAQPTRNTQVPLPTLLPTTQPFIKIPTPTPAPTLPPTSSTPQPTPTFISPSPTPQPTVSLSPPTTGPAISTSSPTSRPTASPTAQPTMSTSTPTTGPTTSTSSPTAQPTISTPTTSTKQPTAKQPTNSPSSRQPSTNYPIETPSLQPSAQPSCLIEIINGTVGVTSPEISVLKYSYEVETDPLSSAPIGEEVIPDLEIAMIKYLSQFVGLKCGMGDQRRVLSHSLTSRRLEGMVGMSASPSDVVHITGCTSSTSTPNNICTPVEGGMSLYLIGDSAKKSMEEVVMRNIELGMQHNVLVDAHDAIIKVTFIQDGFPPVLGPSVDPPTRPPSNDNDSDSDGDTQGLNVVAVLLGALGFSLIAGVMVAARRRTRLRQVVQDEGAREIYFEEASALSSKLSFDNNDLLHDFARSGLHDVDTIRVSNKVLSDQVEINVDLESLRSSSEEEYFDFFDLILEGSQRNSERKDQDAPSDNVSDLT